VNNPLVAQGYLNKLRASVSLTNFSNLNVTAPFLNREGIRLALEGTATEYLPTLTGAVGSPNPYMMCSVTINLLKTQSLSNSYKLQMESSTLIGPFTVRPDIMNSSSAFSQANPVIAQGGLPAGGLGPYEIQNGSIVSVAEQTYDGGDAGFRITLRGLYNINSSLYN
jgi:hypothetical protein